MVAGGAATSGPARAGWVRLLRSGPAPPKVPGAAGPTDTPMQPGSDRVGMNKPADVAAAIFDALESGEDEVLADEMTRRVHSALSQPVTVLYPDLASK